MLFKTKDKKYIIEGLDGIVPFKDNFDECIPYLKKIENNFSKNVKVLKKEGPKTFVLPADKSGESVAIGLALTLKSGGYAEVTCLNWSEKIPYIDHMRLGLRTKNLVNWLKKS